MSGYCTSCGAARASSGRFCARCGADLQRPGDELGDAGILRDRTQEVAPVVAADRPTEAVAVPRVAGVGPEAGDDAPIRPVAALTGARRLDALGPAIQHWWQGQRRHPTRTALTACAALVVVMLAVVWAGSGTSPTPTTSTAAHTRTPTARGSHRLHARAARNGAAIPSIDATRRYVAAMESVLQASAAGRAQLVTTVRSIQPACASIDASRPQQIANVVENRTNLVRQLDALGPAPDPLTAASASLLHQALTISSQADTQYQHWAAALASTPDPTCTPNPTATSALAAARASDASASALKTQFTTLFNALAAQLALPSWSPNDF